MSEDIPKKTKKQRSVEAVTRRRRKLKELAIAYKGGACVNCGYKKCNSALEFHHLDAFNKDFSIGVQGYTRSWESIKTELDKCILVCANCHREIHSESNNSTSGSQVRIL
jgi:hypothetical protein